MLNRILIILVLCGSLAYGAPEQNAPASEASIKQLLEVCQAHKLIDSTMAQMDGFMKSTMQQTTQGQQITPEMQKNIDKRQADMMAGLKEVLDWSKLEPMYVRIYQKSFTQQEVEGMIAFYKTPAGLAVINKMPMVMANTMTEMQQMMGPMIENIQRMQKDVAAEIKAKKEKKSGS